VSADQVAEDMANLLVRPYRVRRQSFWHLRDREGIERLQKSVCLFGMKLSIFRFDAEEKSVLRRPIEFRDAKEWMMRTRQPVQSERSKERSQPGEQHS